MKIGSKGAKRNREGKKEKKKRAIVLFSQEDIEQIIFDGGRGEVFELLAFVGLCVWFRLQVVFGPS